MSNYNISIFVRLASIQAGVRSDFWSFKSIGSIVNDQITMTRVLRGDVVDSLRLGQARKDPTYRVFTQTFTLTFDTHPRFTFSGKAEFWILFLLAVFQYFSDA